MAPMDISELSKEELCRLVDNRVLTVKDFIQSAYDKTKIQTAIDQIKEVLLEVEDRINPQPAV
jgi:hypothetical protein